VTTTYGYDGQGNLTTSDSSSATGLDTTNAYSPDGIRVARQVADPVSGTTTTVLYLGETQITTTISTTAPASTTWARNFTTPHGTPVATHTSDGWVWLMSDAQGSVRFARDALDGVNHWYNYYPFGDPTPSSDAIAPAVSDPDAGFPAGHGYLDKTQDPDGTVRLDHRSYDAGLNILTTPDPLLSPGDPQSLNPYAYSGNNPLRFADPSGLGRCDNCGIDGQTSGPSCDQACQDYGQANAPQVGSPTPTTGDQNGALDHPHRVCPKPGVCGIVSGPLPEEPTDAESRRNIGLGFLLGAGVVGCTFAAEVCAAVTLESVPGAEGTAITGGAAGAGIFGFEGLERILGRGEQGAANAGSKLLSPSSLADDVANATGGVLKTNKGGFTVEIPNGSRGITVRVMERGGTRTNYYRVSVPGMATYTVTGEASTDAALTHMDIGESSLDDIQRIQGAG